MQVILIGSGNIASFLGRILHANGHTIQQVFSPTKEHAQKLAGQLDAVAVTDPSQVQNGADLYLVAVSDSAIPAVAGWLRVTDRLVIHTAGAGSKELMRETSSNYGVLWPVKMVRSNAGIDSKANRSTEAAIVIDGSSPSVLEKLRVIARELSGNIITADDTTRVKMHMIASFTANFSNHLFDLANNYCAHEGIPFEVFYPLIRSAIEQLPGKDPHDLQAGPAFRDDLATIQKHESILTEEPDMLAIYGLMTESIRKNFGRQKTHV